MNNSDSCNSAAGNINGSRGWLLPVGTQTQSATTSGPLPPCPVVSSQAQRRASLTNKSRARIETPRPHRSKSLDANCPKIKSISHTESKSPGVYQYAELRAVTGKLSRSDTHASQPGLIASAIEDGIDLTRRVVTRAFSAGTAQPERLDANIPGLPAADAWKIEKSREPATEPERTENTAGVPTRDVGDVHVGHNIPDIATSYQYMRDSSVAMQNMVIEFASNMDTFRQMPQLSLDQREHFQALYVKANQILAQFEAGKQELERIMEEERKPENRATAARLLAEFVTAEDARLRAAISSLLPGFNFPS
ncbi:MAG: hypothetical protein JWQ23_4162 [Herminiimonas sp.]|nr:hypothetical protein [Herminiimonas sp.]